MGESGASFRRSSSGARWAKAGSRKRCSAKQALAFEIARLISLRSMITSSRIAAKRRQRIVNGRERRSKAGINGTVEPVVDRHPFFVRLDQPRLAQPFGHRVPRLGKRCKYARPE